jgi:4-hydroxybenzoate polyprenyltransferase
MIKKIFQTFNAYIQLVRLPNLLILAVGQYLVRYSIIGPVLENHESFFHTGPLDFALLVLSSVLIAAGGYIINDYFDIRIDAVNRPQKIILYKLIRLRTGMRVYYILTILGCLIGIYVAFKVSYIVLGGIHIIIAVALWYYSLKYKRVRFAGNLTVAVLAAVSLVIVWLFEFFALRRDPAIFGEIINNLGEINILLAGYAIFAFLVMLIREMIKDIEDIEGDRSFRCRTLPIVYGIPLMKKIILAITFFTTGMTAFASYKFFAWGSTAMGLYFSIVLGLLWIYFLIQLFRAKEKKDYHMLSLILKLLIVAGVLSMQLLNTRF